MVQIQFGVVWIWKGGWGEGFRNLRRILIRLGEVKRALKSNSFNQVSDFLSATFDTALSGLRWHSTPYPAQDIAWHPVV